MYDVLDLLRGQSDYPFSGRYYAKLPSGYSNEHIPFEYDVVTNAERHYQKLFSNIVNSDGRTMTIRTCGDIGYRIGEYVALQDGFLYKITEIQINYERMNKQAFRFFDAVPGQEMVLRVMQVDNPWEIE